MGKRVMIVDDSYGDRMILREHLASFGYSVVGEARSIQESLEKYPHLRPDLVVLDAAIPDVDGVSAVMHLLWLDSKVNILVSVTRGQRTRAMEAIQAGAKDFVIKPVNARALHKAVRSLIG